jgi:hypothetical protein
MMEADQDEAAKSPEDQGMRQAGQRPLTNHLPLQHNFPKKLPEAGAEREELETGVRAGPAQDVRHLSKTPPEQTERRANQSCQDKHFRFGVFHSVHAGASRTQM